MAEREGFEPSMRYKRIHEFQSCALDQLSHLSIIKIPQHKAEVILVRVTGLEPVRQ